MESIAEKTKKKKINIKRGIFIVGMLIVPLLNFIFFYVYVNFDSILMAFQVRSGTGVIYTFDNFRLLFEEFGKSSSDLWMNIRNTLMYFALSFLLMPISIMVSYFIYKKILFYRFYRIIFFLPSIISAIVLTILYKNILGVYGPIAAAWKNIFNLNYTPEFFGDSRYAIWACLGYNVWTGFAGNFILIGGAMSRIPDSIIEAGALDGSTPFIELRKIIIPLIWPTVTTLITLNFVSIFSAGGPILLLTEGNYNTGTLSYFIFAQVYFAGGDGQYASAVGMFFTILTIPVVLLTNYVANRKIEAVEY